MKKRFRKLFHGRIAVESFSVSVEGDFGSRQIQFIGSWRRFCHFYRARAKEWEGKKRSKQARANYVQLIQLGDE
jgi:hypothetical protein